MGDVPLATSRSAWLPFSPVAARRAAPRMPDDGPPWQRFMEQRGQRTRTMVRRIHARRSADLPANTSACERRLYSLQLATCAPLPLYLTVCHLTYCLCCLPHTAYYRRRYSLIIIGCAAYTCSLFLTRLPPPTLLPTRRCRPYG